MQEMSEKAKITRAAILKEFNNQLYRDGYKNATLKGICDGLNISTGHLYYYFKKKEELYINLFRDFISKIYIIFNNFIGINIDELKKTLLIDRFARFMNLNVPELKNIRKEIVDYSSIITETALMFSDFYITGLKATGFSYADQDVVIGQQIAVAGEHALQKLSVDGKLPEKDDTYYSELEIKTFFNAIDFPRDKAEYYILTSGKLFDMLDKDFLVMKVYEMDAYDYAENPSLLNRNINVQDVNLTIPEELGENAF